MMNNNIYNRLLMYIEENKSINKISYKETIDYLKELIEEIETEYKGLIQEEEKEQQDEENE